MNILMITKDQKLRKITKAVELTTKNNFMIFDKSSGLLEVTSKILKIKPSVIIIDDDFIKPNSAKIIKTIKEILYDINIIFVTSNNSIKFGRKINTLGIQFYAIKPIEENQIIDLLSSIITNQFNKQIAN